MTLDKPKLAYTVLEAARALGLGKTTIWERIAEGRITARTDGRRTLIDAEELLRYRNALPKRGTGVGTLKAASP